MDLYHLHEEVRMLGVTEFSRPEQHLRRFLLPHLHWRRITWTYTFDDYLNEQHHWPKRFAIDFVAKLDLSSVVLPASCEEVTLELECRDIMPDGWVELALSGLPDGLRRDDGTILKRDMMRSKGYVWVGSQSRRRYYTLRVYFTSGVPEKKYMVYDYWDCLGYLDEVPRDKLCCVQHRLDRVVPLVSKDQGL